MYMNKELQQINVIRVTHDHPAHGVQHGQDPNTPKQSHVVRHMCSTKECTQLVCPPLSTGWKMKYALRLVVYLNEVKTWELSRSKPTYCASHDLQEEFFSFVKTKYQYALSEYVNMEVGIAQQVACQLVDMKVPRSNLNRDMFFPISFMCQMILTYMYMFFISIYIEKQFRCIFFFLSLAVLSDFILHI